MEAIFVFKMICTYMFVGGLTLKEKKISFASSYHFSFLENNPSMKEGQKLLNIFMGSHVILIFLW